MINSPEFKFFPTSNHFNATHFIRRETRRLGLKASRPDSFYESLVFMWENPAWKASRFCISSFLLASLFLSLPLRPPPCLGTRILVTWRVPVTSSARPLLPGEASPRPVLESRCPPLPESLSGHYAIFSINSRAFIVLPGATENVYKTKLFKSSSFSSARNIVLVKELQATTLRPSPRELSK